MKKKKISKKNMSIIIFLLIAIAFGLGAMYQKESTNNNIDSTANNETDKAKMAITPKEDIKESHINLNTADYYELITLADIGDVTARKILDFREENGGFNELQDLVTLELITQSTADKIENSVVVDFK